MWAVIAAAAVVSVAFALLHHVDPTDYALLSVAFISVCSIYANLVSHWAAYVAAKASAKVDDVAGPQMTEGGA